MQPSNSDRVNKERALGAKQKSQSAIEYLMTYSWTILITAIVLALLYFLGAVTPAGNVSTFCVLPGPFTCVSFTLAYNGNFLVSISQSFAPVVSITSIGCNTNSSAGNTIMQTLSPAINITMGTNVTILTKCYENGSITTRKAGNHGYHH